jgi:hypothetical protein
MGELKRSLARTVIRASLAGSPRLDDLGLRLRPRSCAATSPAAQTGVFHNWGNSPVGLALALRLPALAREPELDQAADGFGAGHFFNKPFLRR